jgi:hypothetical protein
MSVVARNAVSLSGMILSGSCKELLGGGRGCLGKSGMARGWLDMVDGGGATTWRGAWAGEFVGKMDKVEKRGCSREL